MTETIYVKARMRFSDQNTHLATLMQVGLCQYKHDGRAASEMMLSLDVCDLILRDVSMDSADTYMERRGALGIQMRCVETPHWRLKRVDRSVKNLLAMEVWPWKHHAYVPYNHCWHYWTGSKGFVFGRMDHSVYAPSQWEIGNVIFYWLGT